MNHVPICEFTLYSSLLHGIFPAPPGFAEALPCHPHKNQRLLPPVRLFLATEGARVVVLRAEQLRSKAEPVFQRPSAQEAKKRFGPKRPEVTDVRPLAVASVANSNLHATGVSNAAMQKSHPP